MLFQHEAKTRAVKFRSLLIWPILALAWLPLAPAASGPALPSVPASVLVPVARFRFDAGAPLLAPAGVATDGSLCVGTVDGYVHSLSADGSYLWSHSVHGAVTRRPLFAGQLWYVATSAERVYALTREGALYWVFKPPSPITSELAADAAGTVFFVGADRYLYGVSAHGGVTLRTALGEPRSGPESGPDGAVWAVNQAGSVLRVRAQEVRRYGPELKPEFDFPDLETVRDPDGHQWRGRSDGVLEFRVAAGAEPNLLTLTSSALLAPVWSARSHYAVLSARSGLVFALEPISVHPKP